MEANVVFSPDTLRASSLEVEDVVADYFANTIAHRDVPPLDFDWDTYKEMERSGNILLVSARTDADDYMIGFVLYMLAYHPHHRTNLVAMCDMIGVRPEYRHHGVGEGLLRVAEMCLRDVQVDRVIHMFRETYAGTTPIFERLGYEPFERAYIKHLSPQRQED